MLGSHRHKPGYDDYNAGAGAGAAAAGAAAGSAAGSAAGTAAGTAASTAAGYALIEGAARVDCGSEIVAPSFIATAQFQLQSVNISIRK